MYIVETFPNAKDVSRPVSPICSTEKWDLALSIARAAIREDTLEFLERVIIYEVVLDSLYRQSSFRTPEGEDLPKAVPYIAQKTPQGSWTETFRHDMRPADAA